ncbi:MAG: S1C family serine protease [Pseudomonadota bacterium]
MIRRLVLLLAMLTAWTAPARADDISAAARGVVRVVTIAMVDGEIVGFGHGTGFAVAPNRIVTNAHVVELALRYPDNVVIGVVPSEGSKSFEGHLVKVDPGRDLALIEFNGADLPALTLYNGPAADGEDVVALGYPGNVDAATAQSAADYIRPLTPVRSQGSFSGMRSLEGISVLLHTASIARGNSGGPLLDRCGRVIGVNRAITNNDDGDSTFAFAIAGSELAGFLGDAGQQYASVGVACTSVEERMAQDRAAAARDKAEAEARERADAERRAAERAEAIAKARDANESLRENYMAGAAVLLVLGALSLGGAGLLASRGRQREAVWVGAGGGVLILGAAALFVSRPVFDESAVVPVSAADVGAAAPIPEGKMVCTLVPERSRVTVSTVSEVTLEFGRDGCINGRTQYAEAGSQWERILVPDKEQTVSVLDYDPKTQTYTNTRYLLSADQMSRARDLRKNVQTKSCSTDDAARANLATQQAAIRGALPGAYNEKLVYRCAAAQ